MDQKLTREMENDHGKEKEIEGLEGRMWKKESFEEEVKAFFEDESGVGVIEVVLILVVLIGLVIVFKDQIGKLLDTIFKQINSQSKEVYS